MTGDELFWALAEELQEDPRVTEGTMMGFRCLRVDGAFMAMVTRHGSLVVKLPEAAVTTAVAAGDGVTFAPAGKVFREWLEVPEPDEGRWRELMVAARRFVARAEPGEAAPPRPRAG